ncbi:MAG: glucose 1-dehydrogenase [Desulfobacteraceae bacterium]|nr:MAG: glucose 1-dehydrogenase [Desulfobacteraceae bacterium]
MTEEELKGKIAIVTGGGAGIGRAISIALAGAGAHVVIPDLNLYDANGTAEIISKTGGEALPLEADISDPACVDLVFDKAKERYGCVDILINNAGTTHPAVSILDLDLSFVESIFAVDYKGLYLCCRRAVKEMSLAKGGSIVNISSIAGLTPLPLVMYGPMKSAVNMLTRILAREWAHCNIRVNAIAPGYVLTPLMEGMINRGLRDPSLIIERTPMKAMLLPEDIAEASLFLVSPKASHITGTILTVDGGWTSDGGWTAYPR